MTIREILLKGREELTAAGISDTVELDTSLLLCHALGIGREQLYARLTDPVDDERGEAFLELVRKRCGNYPVAYLTGTREFFGRDFAVGAGILCPRPDTEILVEKALEIMGALPCQRILDLCSGSGCIGLTMALEKPESSVLCADIGEEPERIFALNRERLGVPNARFVRSDLFEKVEGTFGLILTNPPYLTTAETAERMEEGWKEPALALDGGPDGLVLIDKIVKKSIEHIAPEGYLLVEAAPEQMGRILEFMGTAGFTSLGTADDLAGRKRVAYGRWKLK